MKEAYGSVSRKTWAGAVVLLLCLTLALSIVLAIPVLTCHAAKKKVKLSKKRITLQQGRKVQIKLKNTKKKVKWSVSGKKLVTVKAKGKKKQIAVIKAGNEAGTCKVVAKAGKKKYRCRIIVKSSSSESEPSPQDETPVGEQDTFKEKPLSNSSKDQTSSYKAQQVDEKAADTVFINAMAGTSVRLLQETAAAGQRGENILISPDSILTALAMAQNGAGGDTLSQMEKVLGGIQAETYSRYLYTLHKRVSGSDFLAYHIANSIWYKNGKVTVKKPFLQKNVSYFDSQVLAAPFNQQTVSDINSWVYNHTKGKIPTILDRLAPEMRLALINAIYFKGQWEDPFGDPRKDTFTNALGKKQDAQMLMSTEHTYVSIQGADGFVKPYSGGTVAFMALLPKEGMSADTFVKQLSGKDLIQAYQNRQSDHILVRTKLPEFGYDYEISLTKPLQKLGITLAFSDAADFSQMAAEPVCIDEVLHKTHIELDQNGTEAAAVTAIVMKASSAMDPVKYTIKEVFLDRPFVYALIDTQTGLPLFLGVLNSL